MVRLANSAMTSRMVESTGMIDPSRPGVDTVSINSRTAFHGNSQRAMMPPMLEGAHPGSIVRLFGLRHGHAPQQYRMGCHGQARSSDILLLYFHRPLSASLAGSQRAHCEVHTRWHLHAPCLVNRCRPAHQKYCRHHITYRNFFLSLSLLGGCPAVGQP